MMKQAQDRRKAAVGLMQRESARRKLSLTGETLVHLVPLSSAALQAVRAGLRPHSMPDIPGESVCT